ncbi:MAG: hypothetical protein LBI79_07485 [Nitrososphaerota archaeon]|jgi:hypothetical protein|nr:hypothetical protein [Nitrososphaerota archaeon]
MSHEKIEKIVNDGLLLAVIIRDSDWSKGLTFVSSENDFQQVGMWNYDKGKVLEPHVHLLKPRMISRTQEVLFLKEGALRASIFTEDEKFLKTIDLHKGDTMILLAGGHGYEILEDNTKVLEVKNGPYLGAIEDRKRIQR